MDTICRNLLEEGASQTDDHARYENNEEYSEKPWQRIYHRAPQLAEQLQHVAASFISPGLGVGKPAKRQGYPEEESREGNYPGDRPHERVHDGSQIGEQINSQDTQVYRE